MKNYILSLLFILTSLQAGAFVGKVNIDGIWYTVISKGAVAHVTVGDTKYAGHVVIPETVEYEGTVCQVIEIGDSAFYDCQDLLSVSIPSTVSSIGNCAFQGCINAESINIPEAVTYIGYYAFLDCNSLQEVNLPEGINTIYAETFRGCKQYILSLFQEM